MRVWKAKARHTHVNQLLTSEVGVIEGPYIGGKRGDSLLKGLHTSQGAGEDCEDGSHLKVAPGIPAACDEEGED